MTSPPRYQPGIASPTVADLIRRIEAMEREVKELREQIKLSGASAVRVTSYPRG